MSTDVGSAYPGGQLRISTWGNKYMGEPIPGYNQRIAGMVYVYWWNGYKDWNYVNPSSGAYGLEYQTSGAYCVVP